MVRKQNLHVASLGPAFNAVMISSQIDIKNRRTFLKKIRLEDIKRELLYVGSTVTILSRQLKILDYGDEFTKSQLQTKSERWNLIWTHPTCRQQTEILHANFINHSPCTRVRTLAMIKPDAYKHLGKILNAITQSGFRIK